jgi:hypothetical protein
MKTVCQDDFIWMELSISKIFDSASQNIHVRFKDETNMVKKHVSGLSHCATVNTDHYLAMLLSNNVLLELEFSNRRRRH